MSIKTSIKNSEFLRNASKLVAGAAVAQAISFLLSPVISRLYTPADLGTFTFFMSLGGGLGLLATLRYDMAILLPAKDSDSVSISFISLTIAFLFSLLLFLILFITELADCPVFSKDVMPGYLSLILPLMIFSVAAGNVFMYWYNRKQKYQSLAISKIISSGGSNLLTTGLGFIGAGVWGLVGGNFLGIILSNLFLFIGIIRNHRDVYNARNLKFDKSLIRKHSELPLANTPQMLVELIQLYGIVYLLQVFYPSHTLGLYSLSQRILLAPMWLIGTSLAQVYYKEASAKASSQENIGEVLIRTIRLAALVAAPVLIVMLIAGPWLFGFIFGANWAEAGHYARILAPFIFLDFIRSTIGQTPLIIGKTRSMFFISLSGALLMVAGITIGGTYFRDASTGFMIYSATMSCYIIGVIWWIHTSVKKMNQ